MVFNSRNEIDKKKAIDKLNQLLSKHCYFELTEKTIRSKSQNSYLHSIISWFAHEYGESTEFCKREFYKKTCNRDIFEIEKINKFTGEIIKEYKSSSDISKEEMTKSITNFRDWSAKEANIYLPSSDEHNYLQEIEYQLSKYK